MTLTRTSSAASAFAVLLTVLFALGCATDDIPQVVETENSVVDDVVTFAAFNVDEFGFDTAASHVTEGRIKRNQTFSDILSAHGVDYPIVHNLVQNADTVFDLRGMRAGKHYRIYRDGDSLSAPIALLYEHTSVDYVVFDLVEPYGVHRESRPVHVDTRQVRGRIDNSLYESLVAVDVDPTLAVSLSEVFAWQIDFFRIQKGDSFNEIFDERTVGDRKIGIGDIHTAYFRHASNDYYAFHYPEEGSVAYFDEKGGSLRKAFLRAPVKYSRISSRYSPNRFHPVLRRNRAHLGTDYAAAKGTPILATGDGVVVEASYTRGNGRYVKIRHNGTYTTGYLHMSRIGSGMKAGAKVRQGDVIGYVGSTGLATGNHVCYRFWKNGKQVDPLREDFPSVAPLSGESLAHFMTLRDTFMDRLNGYNFAVAP
jgi:murein DD-endopeptidase MepM/ murein hydrolase activator NlpD